MKIIYDSGSKVAFENMTIVSIMFPKLCIDGVSFPKRRIISKATPVLEI